MTDIIAEAIKMATKPLRDRIAALEARPELKWAGIWTPGEHKPCTLTTRQGSLWLATATTTQTPGQGPDWKLIVKRGQAE